MSGACVSLYHLVKSSGLKPACVILDLTRKMPGGPILIVICTKDESSLHVLKEDCEVKILKDDEFAYQQRRLPRRVQCFREEETYVGRSQAQLRQLRYAGNLYICGVL